MAFLDKFNSMIHEMIPNFIENWIFHLRCQTKAILVQFIQNLCRTKYRNKCLVQANNNLQQVCKHEVVSSLNFTGLLQLEEFIRPAES